MVSCSGALTPRAAAGEEVVDLPSSSPPVSDRLSFANSATSKGVKAINLALPRPHPVTLEIATQSGGSSSLTLVSLMPKGIRTHLARTVTPLQSTGARAS